MPEHQFDRLIREKLHSLALPDASPMWAQMAALLDRAFDARLRSKLHDLVFPLEATAWPEMAARLDRAFDTLIRERLSSLQAGGAEEDWPIMAAMMADQPFDAALLKQLFTLRASYAPEDWQQMARLLDDDALISQLREALTHWEMPLTAEEWPEMRAHLDQVFDQSVRQKLDQVSPSQKGMEADWASLTTALDGGSFDQSVRERLAGLHLPLVGADWSEMADRLDAPFDQAVRQKLAHQLVIMPADEIDAGWTRLAEVMPMPVPAAQGRSFSWRRPLLAAAVMLLLLSVGVGSWWSRQPRLAMNEPVTSQSDLAGPQISPSESETSVENAAPTEPLPAALASAAGIEPPSRVAPVVVSPLPSQAPSWSAVEVNRPEADPLPHYTAPHPPSESEIQSPAAGMHLMPRRHWSLASPFLDGQATLSLLVPPDSRPPEMRIGLIGSITSTKAELSGPQTDPGYLGGMRFEMVINPRWHIVTGLTYGLRRFSHTYFTTIDDQPVPNALDGTMRVVEVPLMLRYHFPSEGKLSLYLQGGVVTVVSIEETYNHFDPSDPANKGAFDPIPRRLRAKEQAWSLNTYPGNVEVALGLEYELNSRFALQVEPFFQQSLQRTKGSGSLGLEKKLYTTGITFGTVFRLNEPQP